MFGAKFLVVVVLGTTLFSGAEAEQASNTIMASGSAEIHASPDKAIIDIGVVTTNVATMVALRSNSAEMARVVAAIREVGIPSASIQTSNFLIEAQHPASGKYGEPDESRTTGYSVTNKVTVIVDDLANVAKVIDAAVTAGANASNSVSFDIKNHASLDDQALAGAIGDARHKAEIMAAAENLKLGRMISATNEMSMIDGAPAFAVENTIVTGHAMSPILPGQISIDARVVAIFAIE